MISGEEAPAAMPARSKVGRDRDLSREDGLL